MTYLYLGAIVAANLAIAQFGPSAAPVVAFVLIGFDLVSRDRLHDQWHQHGRFGLLRRMGALIIAGGMLSYAANHAAAKIAIASVVSFVAAALVDTLVYQLLYRAPALVRSNGSNIPSAAVDSLLFPVLAFGGFPVLIIVLQFLAKALGGFLWSTLIYRREVLPRHA